MQTKKWMQAVAVIVAGAAVLVAVRSSRMPAQAADAGTQEIIRLKLGYAQGALQGIAMEDFQLLALNAQRLSKLSHASGWQSRPSAEYQLFTAEFRRHADALARAARDSNLDAATLAYFQLTVSCVNCHKHLRGARTVQLPGLPRAGE